MAFSKNTERGAMAEMNITPLVDVMLVLLVIFMITSPMPTHRVPLDLPQKCAADKCPPPPERPAARLEVLAQGQLRWDQNLLDPESLPEQLRLHQKLGANLIISSADNTAYADLVKVIAEVGKAGIKRVQLAQ